MENYLVWMMFAAALAGAEMLSGTFYLLVYGMACAAGAAVAWFGFGLAPQYLVAASCAVLGTFWLRRNPIVRPAASSESLDIGQAVTLISWKSPTLARVRYRGADWDAELTDAPLPDCHTFFIVGQRGNTLLVDATPPQQ